MQPTIDSTKELKRRDRGERREEHKTSLGISLHCNQSETCCAAKILIAGTLLGEKEEGKKMEGKKIVARQANAYFSCPTSFSPLMAI